MRRRAGARPARLVPEASSATWNGDVVRVTFQEVGVPGPTTTTTITATGTVDTTCRQDGDVVIHISSSATVIDESGYPVEPPGTVTGSRDLDLSVQPPTIEGFDCTQPPRSVPSPSP